MILTTSHEMPPGFQLVEHLGIVITSRAVRLSAKRLFQALTERNRNEWNEILQAVEAAAPAKANILYAIQTSTAVAQYADGIFLQVTITATSGRCVPA